jgi:structural maintenance of chromosome 4
MKPKAPNEHEDGLLEYLEDIIGTAKYKEPIDEALAEADRLAEERSEKMARLKIVEKEKGKLEVRFILVATSGGAELDSCWCRQRNSRPRRF